MLLASVAARDLDVVRGEVEVGQAFEAFVGCSQHVHGLPPPGGRETARQAASRSMVRRQAAALRPSRWSCSHVSHDVATSRASSRSRASAGRRRSSSGAKVVRSWARSHSRRRVSSAATVGELCLKSSADRRTGATAWNTSARWRTTRRHPLADRERGLDRSDLAPVALLLDLHRGAQDRLEVVEVMEHQPERHPGALGDAPGGGVRIALLEEADHGLGQAPAGALPPGHPPVADPGRHDGDHHVILRILHLRCKKSDGTVSAGPRRRPCPPGPEGCGPDPVAASR